MSEHYDDGGGGGVAIAIGVILVVGVVAGAWLFLMPSRMSTSSSFSSPSRPVMVSAAAVSSSVSGVGSHSDARRTDTRGDWVFVHRDEGPEVNVVFGIDCQTPAALEDPLVVRPREGVTASLPHRSPHFVRVAGPRGVRGVPTSWTPEQLQQGLEGASRPAFIRELLLQVASVDSLEELWSAVEAAAELTPEEPEVP